MSDALNNRSSSSGIDYWSLWPNETTNDAKTDEYECENDESYPLRQLIIMGIILPPLLLFGITASIFNILVFSHKVMRISLINVYLLLLSASDLIGFICATFLFSLPVLAEWSKSLGLHDAAVKSTLILYPIGLISQTFSVYMTVSVSAHRFIGVCFPFRAHEICSRKHVRILLVSIFLFVVCYNISRFFELTTTSCFSPLYNASVTNLAPTAIRENRAYVFGYLGWSYTFVMLVIPFLLLIGMNIRVIAAVHQSRKRHSHMTGSSSNQIQDAGTKSEAAKERSTTIMLVGIVIVFLLCNSLAFVSNMLEMIMREFTDTATEVVEPVYQVIVNISNLMVLVGASLNIFIYLSFSDKYRILLKYFICVYINSKHADYLLDSLNSAVNL